MKIRNGFVSNSSSSSFVILLPKGFDMETVKYEDFVGKDSYSEATVESVKKAMKKFLKDKEFWGEDAGYEEMDVLCDILKPYIVTTIDGGPDESKMILLSNKKVNKILGIADETAPTV